MVKAWGRKEDSSESPIPLLETGFWRQKFQWGVVVGL